MTLAASPNRPAARPAARPATTDRSAAQPGALPVWPLVVLFGGWPLWWVTGTSILVAGLAAAVMAGLLLRRGGPSVPGVWPVVVFGVWVIASVVMIDSGPRLVGALYRGVTLGCGVVVFLYVARLPRARARRVVLALLALVGAGVVAGGWLGMLLPEVRLTTITGRLLPEALAGNEYVRDLMFPPLAEVQTPWGASAPFVRPAAPFPHANGWGAAFVVLVPAALAFAAQRFSTPARTVLVRLAVAAGLLAALVPAVATTNRAMFGAVGVALLWVAVRAGLRGRPGVLLGLLATAAAGVVVLVVSGGWERMAERQQTGRSSDVRADLYALTWEHALRSPLLGYGGPRPAPELGYSMGTQGFVWTLLFSFGFVGLALFAAFVLRVLVAGRAAVDLPDLLLQGAVVGVVAMVAVYGLDTLQLAAFMAVCGLVASGARR